MLLTGPTTSNSPRASEGGHWYDRDGTPRYEVRAKNGQMRPATLRDARKFGWYPGCTSIIRCAAAPGLERWKIDQHILASLTLPRIPGESNDQLVARIKADADEQAKKARERGTEVHAAIQGHFEGTPPAEEFWPYVKGILAVLEANFGERNWIPELPVAHPLGFGTKSDLHCRGELPIVLDFKGVDCATEEEMAALKTYDEHDQQLAATREALLLREARCGIVFYSRPNSGLARVVEVDEADLVAGWDAFRGLANYWKATRRYYPELWTPEKVAA